MFIWKEGYLMDQATVAIYYEKNPVKRLHRLLQRFLDSDDSFSQKKSNIILKEVFDIDPTDRAAFYSLLVDLLHLVKECKSKIALIPNVNTEIFLAPILDVERAIFTIEFDSNTSKFRDELKKNNTMQILTFCSETLKQVIDEVSVNADDIDSLQGEVEALRENIIKSTLPPDLKKVFVEKLENILKAIIDIRIMGIDGLQKALESGAGALFLNKEEVDKNLDNEDVQGFVGVLRKINEMVNVAKNIKELAAPFLGFFLESGDK